MTHTLLNVNPETQRGEKQQESDRYKMRKTKINYD